MATTSLGIALLRQLAEFPAMDLRLHFASLGHVLWFLLPGLVNQDRRGKYERLASVKTSETSL